MVVNKFVYLELYFYTIDHFHQLILFLVLLGIAQIFIVQVSRYSSSLILEWGTFSFSVGLPPFLGTVFNTRSSPDILVERSTTSLSGLRRLPSTRYRYQAPITSVNDLPRLTVSNTCVLWLDSSRVEGSVTRRPRLRYLSFPLRKEDKPELTSEVWERNCSNCNSVDLFLFTNVLGRGHSSRLVSIYLNFNSPLFSHWPCKWKRHIWNLSFRTCRE